MVDLRPLRKETLVGDPSLGIGSNSVVNITPPWHNGARAEQVLQFCGRETSIGVFIIFLKQTSKEVVSMMC